MLFEVKAYYLQRSQCRRKAAPSLKAAEQMAKQNQLQGVSMQISKGVRPSSVLRKGNLGVVTSCEKDNFRFPG